MHIYLTECINRTYMGFLVRLSKPRMEVIPCAVQYSGCTAHGIDSIRGLLRMSFLVFCGHCKCELM